MKKNGGMPIYPILYLTHIELIEIIIEIQKKKGELI